MVKQREANEWFVFDGKNKSWFYKFYQHNGKSTIKLIVLDFCCPVKS